MLPLIDGLQNWLTDHREEIDPGMLYRFSVKTLAESRNPEAVKFALSLLELLQPTQEIRRWLLTEGWDNHILSAYSARLCAQRGGLDALLAQEALTPEDFAAASGLVAALLDEGPVRNISVMEDGKELLEAYLRHAGGMARTEEQRQTAEAVRRWLQTAP